MRNACTNAFFKNPYVRALAGGLIVIGLTMLAGNQTYNGTGMNIITGCMEGKTVFPLAFLLKMIFTAATLGAGYKGGEIVPTLFIGSTFGTFFCLRFRMFHPTVCCRRHGSRVLRSH